MRLFYQKQTLLMVGQFEVLLLFAFQEAKANPAPASALDVVGYADSVYPGDDGKAGSGSSVDNETFENNLEEAALLTSKLLSGGAGAAAVASFWKTYKNLSKYRAMNKIYQRYALEATKAVPFLISQFYHMGNPIGGGPIYSYKIDEKRFIRILTEASQKNSNRSLNVLLKRGAAWAAGGSVLSAATIVLWPFDAEAATLYDFYTSKQGLEKFLTLSEEERVEIFRSVPEFVAYFAVVGYQLAGYTVWESMSLEERDEYLEEPLD